MNIDEILKKIASEYAPGDPEFYKVLVAITLAESGGNPNAVGDNGNSIGLFQNNMAGGRGAGYTAEQLKDPEFNARLAASELIYHYKQGLQRGLKGKDLVAYVSRYGQRPAQGLEWNAAANYGRSLSEGSTVTNEPQMHQYQTQYQKPQQHLSPLEQLKNIVMPQAYAEQPYSQNYSPVSTPSNQYTVKSGDTLWDIAQRTLGSGNRWGQLGYSGDPTKLSVGQKLNIPQSMQPNTSTPQGPVYTPPPTPVMPQPDFSQPNSGSSAQMNFPTYPRELRGGFRA